MSEGTYWGRRWLSRRAAIRGAGLGITGLAGALLLGCGGDDDAPSGDGGAATGTAAASGGTGVPVPADEVRLPAGTLFEGNVPATAAEQDPLTNAKYGGTLTFRQFDSPHFDFNRVLSSTVNTPNDLTKNKLFRLQIHALADLDSFDLEPDLAQSFEVNADATEFTFHLQQGAKFHNTEPVNGRVFTSEDARLSIERYQTPGGAQQDVFSPVIGIETPDDYTIVLKLNQPFAEFPRTTASWSYMDAKETIAIPDFIRDNMVGTGPFIQTEWVPKERQVFVRHPDYFETGYPFLDQIVGQVLEDAAAIRAAFQTENFVDLGVANAEEAEIVLGNTRNAVLRRSFSVQGANVNGFHFQMNNPKYQDERVRRAFSLAIDRVEWDLARRGPDDTTHGFSNPPIARRFLHDSVPTLESHGPWYQYDPEQASELLQAAGYSASNPLTAVFKAWYARNDWTEIMIPQFDRIPELSISFEQVDNPTAVTLLNDRNFDDPVNITWGPPAYSVDQMVYPWYHSQGGLNFNNINDATMDELVTAQRAEQNEEARRDIWRQIEERYFDQVWDVFTPTGVVQRNLWQNWALNYRPHGLGRLTTYGTQQLRGVWLDNI